jgi:uroporphyrin-III C-methyltransferase
MNDPRAEDHRDDAGEKPVAPEPSPQHSDPETPAADKETVAAGESPGDDATQGRGAGDSDTAGGDPGDGSSEPPRRGGGKGIGLFALLLALVALGVAGFFGWLVFEQRELAAEQRAGTAERLGDMRDLVASTQERLAVQEERLAVLSAASDDRRDKLEEMASSLRQLHSQVDAIMREEAGPERAPALAEIEFLLLLAGRELKLAGNPRVALAALREADARVARLEEPGLGEVRAAINDEIAAVETVADVDLEGIALRLASLARRVDGLPLHASLSPDPVSLDAADEDAGGWERFRARATSVASSLFRIRRTDQPAAPLLAPDESFFLYRNVELDLKSARLAALARDPDNYAAGLASARDALERYFETGDDSVKSLLAAIGELEQRDVAPEWPEISRSLQRLRAVEAGN